MANTQVTEQHFVPRFYLRRFCNEGNEVQILDLKQRKLITPRGPKGICREDFFYAVKTGEADEISQHVELFLKAAEDRSSKCLISFIDKTMKEGAISDQDKWEHAYFMSMIWLRGPAMRSQMKNMEEGMAKHALRFLVADDGMAHAHFDRFDQDKGRVTSPSERQKIINNIRNDLYEIHPSNEQHLMFLDKAKNFANMFYGQYWTVYLNKSPLNFVTSDNPVAVYIPKYEGFYPPTFLEREHYFVVSPKILIEAKYNLTHTKKTLKRRTLFEADVETVKNLNFKIAKRGMEFVYGQTENELNEILREIQHIEQANSSEFSKRFSAAMPQI